MICPLMTRAAIVLAGMCWCAANCAAAGVNYEDPPISYSTTDANNVVTSLQARLTAGDARLVHEPQFGYLRSLLKEFDLHESSQVLPFAKVSLQKPHISPETPRAIYFNDDVHLGYVQEGLIELAVVDPALGVVFYTLSQQPDEPVVLQRGNNSCLSCHGGLRTQGVPGLQVRSVFTDSVGQPVIAAGSFTTTTRSQLEQRWGGWYVTGTHGQPRHLGNFVLADPKRPKEFDNAAGQNCTDLSPHFDTTRYLTPHSDIVALMVLEHQSDVINTLTRAQFEVRRAEAGLGASGTDAPTQDLRSVIDASAESVVNALLFSEEASLISPIQGTSTFVHDFRKRGPFDASGRTLRDFDLRTRLFKYPVSYLVYSTAFRCLPDKLRLAVYDRLRSALAADSDHPAVARLTADERQVVVGILSETLADWPQADRPDISTGTSQP
ncbi:MAG: hypothetical protein R3B90_06375 [Planctomycetaceae bacterium]